MDYPPSRHTVTGRPAGSGPAHADRPRVAPARVAAAAAVAAAALAGVGFGAAACLSSLEPARSTPTSANRITVSPGTDTAAPAPR